MKYVLIIIDGAADLPLEALGGKTPLEAASVPGMDEIASLGTLGRVTTCPAELSCGSDVAIMSVLGYNPRDFYTGRAPIEAAAQDILLDERDWIFRTNIVTIRENIMKDHSAENIGQAEADRIIALLNRECSEADLKFYSGVSYRNLMIVRRDIEVTTTPPHDILGLDVTNYLPRGRSADFLNALITRSQHLLKANPVNPNATSVWFWGQGKKPRLESFYERFAIRGAVITGVDLVRGLAKLAGWDVIKVPGVTAYFDTNYQGKGEYAIEALENHDLVCVHIEAPDEAGHKGDWNEKVRALENIDTHIVRPLLAALRKDYPDWRVHLLPDHPTPCSVRTHTYDPIPFAMCSNKTTEKKTRGFCEKDAASSDVYVERGHTLMKEFLTGGKLID